MIMERQLTAEYVRELFDYDPRTGVLLWRKRRSRRVKAGDVAGWRDSNGYIVLEIEGHAHKAHRIAWLITHGRWPRGDIDHANGIRDDNRISNLRQAARAENNQNQRRARSDSKTGLLGVSSHYGKWKARIGVNGRDYHLGTFKTPEDAHKAYLDAKARIHPFWVSGGAD